jgi:hypothetical protein
MSKQPHEWLPAGMASSAMSISVSYMLSRAVHVVTTLGIPDLLNSGPKTATELAEATGTHAPSLERLLLALESFDIFGRTDSRFTLTAVSDPLRHDAPNSVKSFVLCSHAQWQTRAWEEALFSIRTGAPSFSRITGRGFFEYFAEHPVEGQLFDESMKAHTATVLEPLVACYTYPPGSHIVDLAGGDGSFLAEILKKNPTCHGTLLETEALIGAARRNCLVEKLDGRLKLLEGNIFQDIPHGAEVYLLKHVLHDWGDEQAQEILARCAAALPAHGRVLIFEAILNVGQKAPYQRLLDLGMLLLTGGKERSEGEYRTLCENSGLTLSRIVPTRSMYYLIEALRRTTDC